METLFIPGESDFKLWIKEAIKESVEALINVQKKGNENEEPLLSRKEIAKILKISLVTLSDWTKKGLPFYRQGIKQYFIRSEVLNYMKENRMGQYKFSKRFSEAAKID